MNVINHYYHDNSESLGIFCSISIILPYDSVESFIKGARFCNMPLLKSEIFRSLEARMAMTLVSFFTKLVYVQFVTSEYFLLP